MESIVVSSKQGRKYDNEEDRRESYRKSQLKYATKPWTCKACNTTILLGNKTKHLKSQKHLQLIN